MTPLANRRRLPSSSFEETVPHAVATIITGRPLRLGSDSLRSRGKTFLLVKQALRQRRRTGNLPVWFPAALEAMGLDQDVLSDVTDGSLGNSRVPLTETLQATLLPKLAQFALRANFVGVPPSVDRPSQAQMGLNHEPWEIVVDDATAALLGEMDGVLVVAFKGGPSLEACPADQFAEISLNWYLAETDSLEHRVPGKVNRLFREALNSLWGRLEPFIAQSAGDIILVGHGRGAAIATLAAMKIQKQSSPGTVNVVTFGSPPVGDQQFAAAYNSAILHHYRYEIDDDIVPHFQHDPLLQRLISPHQKLTHQLHRPPYAHVGQLRYIHEGRLVVGKNEIALDRERRFRLFSLLCSSNRIKTATDHSLAGSYLPAITAGLE